MSAGRGRRPAALPPCLPGCLPALLPLLPSPLPSRPAPVGIDSTRHNYLLLGLAIFQFPLNAWLARVPPLPPAVAAAASGAAAQAAGLM